MASCGMQPANQTETQELARVAQQVAERSSKILGEFAQKQTQSMSAAVRDEMGIAKAFMDLYARLAADPALLASMSMNFWVDQWRPWQSSWQKLVRGLIGLLADVETGGGQLGISMTDGTAFHLGGNVATSPGKVVFQTDLMQLIQYQPSTSEVYRRPLVIIPPWINKYYILDLREKNSFIRWAVERGHTVFVLSWVNPDAKLAQKGFDDYMVDGPLAAMDFVARATGQREVNVIGYCLGGTLLGATLGYLAAKGDDRVKC